MGAGRSARWWSSLSSSGRAVVRGCISYELCQCWWLLSAGMVMVQARTKIPRFARDDRGGCLETSGACSG
jgi:hypothetical protein